MMVGSFVPTQKHAPTGFKYTVQSHILKGYENFLRVVSRWLSSSCLDSKHHSTVLMVVESRNWWTPAPACGYRRSTILSITEPLEANAGALTNFEVLDFLQSRGASKDPTRVLAPIKPSEYKVYDYLADSVSCSQTREKVTEFVEKCKKYRLAKAEVLNIINIRPSLYVEIYPIIEEADSRFEEEQIEELLELVKDVLPPRSKQTTTEEGNNKNEEGNANGKPVFEDKKEIVEGENKKDNDITADGEVMDDS